MNQRTITRRVGSCADNLKSYFKNLHTKEELRGMLDKVKKSKPSAYPTNREALFRMLDECKIKYEKKEYEYDKFPYKDFRDCIDNAVEIPENRKEFGYAYIFSLFKLYKEYPTPEEYMKRIVDGLSEDDDWKSDTLRLRILKQFIKYGNCLTYKNSNDKTVNIYGGKKQIVDYLKKKDKKCTKINIVDFLHLLDDDIFEVLDTASAEQKKPDGIYGILKMVDDLATGKFRTNGATKKSLYMFAMAYSMTFCLHPTDMPIVNSDIEINLFQDYYNNNLMRFLTDDYKNKKSNYEADPSGQGINYKNFAEVVYLYYISKDYSPAEKIKKSDEMINRITTSANKNNAKIDIPKDHQTMYYKELVKPYNFDSKSKNKMNLDEEKFEKFICENYNCQKESETVKISNLQLELSQNTAFEEYDRLREDLKEVTKNEGNILEKELKKILKISDKPLENCNEGLCFFNDEVEDIKKYIRKQYKIDEEQFENRFNEFLDLLKNINRFLGGDRIGIPYALTIDSAEKITRTSIIVAYYYYFNEKFLDYTRSNYTRSNYTRIYSFATIYDYFKDGFDDIDGIDKILVNAGYQPISEKNIFDMWVIFSSHFRYAREYIG